MFRASFIASCVLCLFPLAAQAATSQASNTFYVNKPYDQVLSWYTANRSGIYRASNCRILEDRGQGEYLVLTNSQLGPCRYIVRETHEDDLTSDGRRRSTYYVRYVRNVSGRLVHQEVTIALIDRGSRTEFRMWISSSVSGRFIPTFTVRNAQNGSLQGCEAFVVSQNR